MVLYFTSDVVDPPAKIYMGKDKEENEVLIRWGWPEDVWFHVDKLSSAHVYLRLQEGQCLDDISPALLEDCCQLVKANSIEGHKKNNLDVVYTAWSNLKKTGEMVTGQVGFHNEKAVKRVRVEKVNEIVNRLNKTKVVKELGKEVDLQGEREERDAAERRRQKEQQRIRKQKEENEREAHEREKAEKSYDQIFQPAKMKTNKEEDGNLSDGFM